MFEALMADVLRSFGYRIDRIPSTNYAGMEVDVEGTHIVTGHALYAECKCYDSEIDSPKFQAFFGKFTARWLKDPKATGLFIAIPGLNPHAKAFYIENCSSDARFTVGYRNEDQVIDALSESGKLAHLDVFRRAIPIDIGVPGEAIILALRTGLVVVQRVVPKGSVLPSQFMLFDAQGGQITDGTSIDQVMELEPELRSFELISLKPESSLSVAKLADDQQEPIVEVKGGSECFEYQFPSSPAHFVGRTDILDEIHNFAAQIIDSTTSTRGFLLEANSGWGKSSCVLACAHALEKAGHFAVVIDSRSASSAQFILRVVEHALIALHKRGLAEAGELSSKEIFGFDDAAVHLIALGNALKTKGSVAIVFLDQFENLFFLPDSFRRIRDVFFKVASAATNVAFGFCWKTDLVGLTNEFPYQVRDSIRATSRVIPLAKFSEPETNALLNKLSEEIRSKLRKDLRFFLSEYSQGYPWLLKKLCAHVKKQRESGVSQADIANALLNVDQLFREDLMGLSLEEESSLRRIAKLSPVNVSDIGDEVGSAILQSLIDRRLVVRIGPKLDIYWDIFRDYLNTGKIPAQEQYLPRLGTRSVYRACKTLLENGGMIRMDNFATTLRLSSQSTYNVIHELRMLGLAKFDEETVTLLLPHGDVKDLPRAFSQQVADKFKKNRLAHYILDALNIREHLTIAEAANLLREKCPYISASQKTWEVYAEVFCDWLESGTLLRYQQARGEISRFIPGEDIKAAAFSSTRKRGGVPALQVHFSPVEKIVRALIETMKARTPVDWRNVKPSTREKCLLLLEDFGFVGRADGRLRLSREFSRFLEPNADVHAILASSAKDIHSFSEFLVILEKRKDVKTSLLTLGKELKLSVGAEWSDGTALTTAKISLDWARHTGLAPGRFAQRLRREKTQDTSPELSLLFNSDSNKAASVDQG